MNTFQLVTAAARAAANWTIQRLLAHPLDKARPAVFLSSNVALRVMDSKWEAVTSVNGGVMGELRAGEQARAISKWAGHRHRSLELASPFESSV